MVVDEKLRQVPVGVEGEIVIGGDGLAFGYHNMVDLTAEKFIASPGNENQRWYRTGDRGRWLPGGRLEHLGRFDTQLKVRGYRIEAGDVEHNLASAPGVSKVAVAKRSGPQGDERLVAFVVPEPGRDVDAMTLRRHLRDR
jgi:acyl-coenzyme A synthetase/AMP-(fatty) acid ligase